jgi:ABC-type transport system involved in multi-copper enzyme maturation permease subunit
MTAATVSGLTFTHVLKAEWIKFRSLRSTWITYAVALLVADGLGVLIAGLRGNDIHHHGVGFGFDPVAFSLHGIMPAQLALGVVGVLFVTGEYATGSIRSTMTAVPRRVQVLLAKTLVFATITFVVALLMTFVAFFAGQAVLSTWSLGVPLSHSGALRAVLGGAFYVTMVGLMGLGLGFAIRSTGGAIATLFGVVLVLPLIVQALPTSWQDHITKFLPLPIAESLITTVFDPFSVVLQTGWGLVVLAGYALAALAIGLTVLLRRDV